MRRWMLWWSVMAAALFVAAFGYGCGETSFGTCADNGTCAPDAGSGVDGTADTAPGSDAPIIVEDTGTPRGDAGTDAAPGCDTTAEPKDQACLVSEAYGIFVSTAGTGTGLGTMASPVSTIDKGLTLAATGGTGGLPKNVYVCGGHYDETITVDATRDNPRVFGGFSCANGVWKYVGDVADTPVLAPSAQGVPLTLTGLTSALFADLEIDAQSAPSTPPVAVDGGASSISGASSIGVVANSSMGVEFRRAKIVAGNGQPGANGVLVPYAYPSAATLRGNAASGSDGGTANAYSCPGGLVTVGGKGGDSPAGSGDPGLPALDGGAGETSAQCVGGIVAGVGASSSSAPNGAGASSAGAFVSGVWLSAAGVSGGIGEPGQGGGGGGAVSPGGGGGGGAGGCGGAGGGAGGGGGASVSIASIGTTLALTNVTLVSGNGGSGGAGTSGQQGQSTGGNGGLQDQNGGCPGGRGGTGGAGGAGGGGSGGVSAGVLYKAVGPTVDTTTGLRFAQGQHGAKGSGGVPGTNDGIDGPIGIQVLAP